MRLKPVKLSHFRGYRATTVIPILKALALIFDGRENLNKAPA